MENPALFNDQSHCLNELTALSLRMVFEAA